MQAIARISWHVMIIAVICFGIIFGAPLSPWVRFLLIGVSFFLCCLSFFINYFAWTAYYLLSGYELDKNLNVVKIKAVLGAGGAAR